MDEFACIRVGSRSKESSAEFNSRLIAFWSGVIRANPDAYALVCAESSRFEPEGDFITRRYLVAEPALAAIEQMLTSSGLEFHPVDRDEVAPAQLDAVDAGLPRREVDQSFHDEHHLGPARTAVGPGR